MNLWTLLALVFAGVLGYRYIMAHEALVKEVRELKKKMPASTAPSAKASASASPVPASAPASLLSNGLSLAIAALKRMEAAAKQA